MDKVMPEPNSGCWLWSGAAKSPYAGYGEYGSFWANGKSHQAHRWFYESIHGQVGNGIHLDHLCRVSLCVNPSHLEPVTPAENTRRGAAIPGNFGKRGRNKTRCPQGHPYTPENTYLNTQHNGRHVQRKCKICVLARQKKYYYQNKVLDGKETQDG